MVPAQTLYAPPHRDRGRGCPPHRSSMDTDGDLDKGARSEDRSHDRLPVRNLVLERSGGSVSSAYGVVESSLPLEITRGQDAHRGAGMVAASVPPSDVKTVQSAAACPARALVSR